MIRSARQLSLTDADGAVGILFEMGEQLPEPNRLCTGYDSELSLGLPASVTWSQKLVRHRTPHERRDQSNVASLNGCSASHRRSSQEHDATRGLLRVALQETIDHQAAQAVTHEMQTGRPQVPYEPLQAGSNLSHGGAGSRVSKRMHLHPELT